MESIIRNVPRQWLERLGCQFVPVTNCMLVGLAAVDRNQQIVASQNFNERDFTYRPRAVRFRFRIKSNAPPPE
jgi:hypothetical protein